VLLEAAKGSCFTAETRPKPSDFEVHFETLLLFAGRRHAVTKHARGDETYTQRRKVLVATKQIRITKHARGDETYTQSRNMHVLTKVTAPRPEGAMGELNMLVPTGGGTRCKERDKSGQAIVLWGGQCFALHFTAAKRAAEQRLTLSSSMSNKGLEFSHAVQKSTFRLSVLFFVVELKQECDCNHPPYKRLNSPICPAYRSLGPSPSPTTPARARVASGRCSAACSVCTPTTRRWCAPGPRTPSPGTQRVPTI
jgi:hypothetical protein